MCLVSDIGSNCIEFANMLGVKEENSTFTIAYKNLFYFFDPTHLLKATRNNLLSHAFHWDDQKASWKYIEAFYLQDNKQRNRLASKLSNSHIYPTNFEKIRIKFAAQVLSNNVAAGLETYIKLKALPSTAMGTAETI